MTGARSHSGTKTDKSQDHSPSVTQTARLPSKRQHKKPRTNRGRYPQGTTHASKVAAVLITSSRFSNQTGRVSASRGPRCNKYCTVLMKQDCTSQKRKKSMWDDICVPFTERMRTNKVWYKRSQTLFIYPKSFWLPCGMTLLSFLNTTHAQK